MWSRFLKAKWLCKSSLPGHRNQICWHYGVAGPHAKHRINRDLQVIRWSLYFPIPSAMFCPTMSDCFSSFSTTTHWSVGWNWKTFPEMSMPSTTVCWKASLCSGGIYSFHLLPNMKNMYRPPCCRVTVLPSCVNSWRLVTVDIWFEEIKLPLCNYFIRLTNNQMKGGLRFEKPGCWDFERHPVLHVLF